MQNQSVGTATAETVAPRENAPGAATSTAYPILDSRRNKFGQLSALFTDTDGTEKTTHGEHMILRTIREYVATENDPIANADWAAWSWLRIEVEAHINGHKVHEIDRKSNPIGYLAVAAVALWIKSERKRDKKRRKAYLRKSKDENTSIRKEPPPAMGERLRGTAAPGNRTRRSATGYRTR